MSNTSKPCGGWLRESAGYTFVEAMAVVGVIGVVAAVAAPSITRFQSKHQVQAAAAQVGGMLQQVRARATGGGIPHLVLFQQEGVVDGERSAFALIVRDNDRSFSLTPPDEVETFWLDPSLRPEVRQYGEAAGIPIYQDMLPAADHRSPLVTASGSSGSGSSGSGSSGSGSGGGGSGGSGSGGSGSGGSGSGGSGSGGSGSSSSGSSGSGSATAAATSGGETVMDSVTNGTTFSVSDDAGVPAIAFNEQGIPVSLDSPQDWGTGAGAVYITDNENAVYATVLSPLGEVSLDRYDATTSTWK